MVSLTMTPSMVEALVKIRDLEAEQTEDKQRTETKSGKTAIGGSNVSSKEPSLENPEVGNPVSHSQAIELARRLKANGIAPSSLDVLLRGARVYIAPPPPKPEPTPEYKALMARLRREEEERTYDRLTNPPPIMEGFRQTFPASSAAHAFDFNHYPTAPADPFAEKDEVTYADVDRQIALIFNVLVSIFACAGGIWVAAKWWSTPARLALSMTGSMLVGLAEVVVYSSYVRKVGQSKGKERVLKEVKEVVNTWVVGGDLDAGDGGESSTLIKSNSNANSTEARKRKK